MKTSALFTLFNSNNYGATLQAYATVKNLEKLRVESKIINYVTPDDKRRNQFLVYPKSIGDLKYDLKAITFMRTFLKRRYNFKKFIKTHFKLTKKYTLKNYKNISKESFDYFITGSDQTFSMNLWKSPEQAVPYFIPFPVNGKKISYSSSIGEHLDRITEEQAEFMKTHLSDFESIAVREETAADYIEKIIGKKPPVTFDPTITLTREEWDKIENPVKPKEKYIFFYGIIPTPWVSEYVNRLSKETGLKVISPSPYTTKEIIENIENRYDCGPNEFISLIKNAEMVVTSSFHGTIFSMIYGKPFASLIVGSGNRVSTLLKLASMENFAFRDGDEVKIQTPDPVKIKALQDLAIKTNKEYLENNLK